MFSESERLIFRYEVAGRVVFADPLDLRRKILRASAGRFYAWWAESDEPEGPPAAADLPPPEAAPPPADGQTAAGQRRSVAEAHQMMRHMAAFDAQERCVAALREVFALPPLDAATGEGVPESECWRLLDEYHAFLEKKERAGGTSPSISPADSHPETAGVPTTATTSPSS